MRARVVVAEGKPLLREALALMLEKRGLDVVATTGDGAEAVRLAGTMEVDVVVIDLVIEGIDGVEAAHAITTSRPRTQVVIISQYADDESVLAAIDAGAAGYLTFDATGAELAAAVATVMKGGAVLDPLVQRRLIERVRNGASRKAASPATDLTGRELDVLRLIAAGLSNTEIAERFHLSEATIKSHVNSLLAKTGLRDRAQAVAYAYRHGVVEQG